MWVDEAFISLIGFHSQGWCYVCSFPKATDSIRVPLKKLQMGSFPSDSIGFGLKSLVSKVN